MEDIFIVAIAVLLGGFTGYSNYMHRSKTETNTTHTRILIEQLVETQKTLQLLSVQQSASQSQSNSMLDLEKKMTRSVGDSDE